MSLQRKARCLCSQPAAPLSLSENFICPEHRDGQARHSRQQKRTCCAAGLPQHLDLVQQELVQPWQVSLMHVQAMQQAWGQSLVEWYKGRAKTLHHQVTPRVSEFR